MPVPSAISDLSQTEGSNSPPGSESPITADNYLRQYAAFIAMLRDGIGFTDPVQLASATTTSIGAQNAMFVEITGTTTITGFGTTYNGPRFLRFTGALTLTHNATTLNLPGGANIVTAAGDTCIAVPNFAGNGWNVYQYQHAIGNFRATRADVASASTVDLSSVGDDINITGTTTITAFTIGIGRVVRVRFNAALTLTNNASIVTQTGGNITTAAGDTCMLRATAANTVEVLCYTKGSPTIAATQAEQESPASTTAFVSPARQQYHQSAIKAWAVVTQSAGSYTLAAAYNLDGVTPINKTGTGQVTVNLDVDMSSTSYGCIVTTDAGIVFGSASRTSAGAIAVSLVRSSTEAYTDAGFTLLCVGDQA